MYFFLRSFVVMAMSITILTGCASNVTRDAERSGSVTASTASAHLNGRPVLVKVTLNANAQEALRDNPVFSTEKLQAELENVLTAHKLLAQKDDGSAMRLNVELTGIRARSNLSAIMLGFLAGNDFIDGKVSLIDSQGQSVDHFNVSTSYAFGGLAGGQEDVRMNWLYRKFAEKTLSELQPE
ncbi:MULTISPECIES: DUF4410 domain-containing protein [Burkholderia]|uniref:DUF4410 domain-containing protein n=1 Tax=Burkholderia TaxID=32008 RepID=UPI00064F9D3D|nr:MULTISPECIES: DUF4410 domain-containing protein [Burkholderia]KML07905.1 hypothetical protein VL00_26900 [Burkholderia cepacia]KMN62514.1 hypothetical protein VK92_01945 [Burkholderia sp. LK4]